LLQKGAEGGKHRLVCFNRGHDRYDAAKRGRARNMMECEPTKGLLLQKGASTGWCVSNEDRMLQNGEGTQHDGM